MTDSDAWLNLINGLDDALIWMVEKFNEGKNWGSVRETTYVLDLLIQYGFAFQSSFIYDGVNWLLNERRGDSWMEEQWETAVALKALSKVKETDISISEIMKAAEDWIIHKQDSRDGLWNDELWESSFVLWYFLEAGKDETLDLITRPMRWLTSKQSKQDGSIVVPHYTAFYLILQSYLKRDDYLEGKRNAIKWFMDNYSPEDLWSDCSYSNGYAIYGLLRNGVKFKDEMKQSLIKRVLELQDEEKSWGEENIEDTYAYLLGLRELLAQEIMANLSKKSKKILTETDWEILEKGYLQYYQYLGKMNLKKEIYDELITRQIKRVKGLVEQDKKLHAFLLFCLLINQEIYSEHKNEIYSIIETFLWFGTGLIKTEEYELLYHFIQTLNQIGIKDDDIELVKKVDHIVGSAIENLIKIDKENWLKNYIETGSDSVIYLSEAEGKLDRAFRLLNILIDSNNFGQTIRIFDKIEEIIIKKRENIDDIKIKEFIKLILKVSTHLYLSQQEKIAEELYQKLKNLILNVLKYKDLDVITLLKDAWLIESIIGYSHNENFWAYLLYNAILDQDAYFSEILYKIFMKVTDNVYHIDKAVLYSIEKKLRELSIEASRIEFTLNKLKNQYKISLRLSQKTKFQAPIRILDNTYIDQNTRNILLQIFKVIHFFPFAGVDKESCDTLIQDEEFLGWKVEAYGAPPDVDQIMGYPAAEVGCDLLYFLGRTLFLLLPSTIREVFLHLQNDMQNTVYLQLQVDDIEIPWDFFHDGKNFLINALATGNIVMEPTEYKMIKPIEFGKDKINVLLIGNPTGDLEYTIDEVKKICEGLKDIFLVNETKLLLRNEASKENILEHIKSGKYQIIHYAGHTLFNEKMPAYSGLVLAGDQLLTGHELEDALEFTNNKLSYHPFIYLNSCDASKIKAVESKDGTTKFDGISISLIRGGALGCIGNYWEVEDEAIRDFSITFYKLLLAGTPVGEAMLKARNKIYPTRMNTFECSETKKITFENRSWGSPKLFGEVQISLIEKQD